jgi:hypothetical protein
VPERKKGKVDIGCEICLRSEGWEVNGQREEKRRNNNKNGTNAGGILILMIVTHSPPPPFFHLHLDRILHLVREQRGIV